MTQLSIGELVDTVAEIKASSDRAAVIVSDLKQWEQVTPATRYERLVSAEENLKAALIRIRRLKSQTKY